MSLSCKQPFKTKHPPASNQELIIYGVRCAQDICHRISLWAAHSSGIFSWCTFTGTQEATYEENPRGTVAQLKATHRQTLPIVKITIRFFLLSTLPTFVVMTHPMGFFFYTYSSTAGFTPTYNDVCPEKGQYDACSELSSTLNSLCQSSD